MFHFNKLGLFILSLLALAGCGGTSGSGTRASSYTLPNSAHVITNGYVAGDLVVSGRFLTEDKLEITSATLRYTENGQNVVTPAAVSIFERNGNGVWSGTSAHTIADRSDTFVTGNHISVWLGGWLFTPARYIVRGGLTALVKQPDGSIQELPILDATPNGWCQGQFQPQWPVAISPSGRRLLAIGSTANSTYTRPDGSVELPMAVVESN